MVTMASSETVAELKSEVPMSPGFPREPNDIYHSLELFCNAKNLPVAKYKSLLRSSSSQLSTPSTPTNNNSNITSTPSPSPSTSQVWGSAISNSNTPAPSTPQSERFSLSNYNGSNGSLSATNLQSLRFSFGQGSGSFQNLSSSNGNGKRSSDEEDNGSAKRVKRASNLNVKLKIGLSHQQCLTGGMKTIQYQCHLSCSSCEGTKDKARCPACSGTGRILLPRSLEIDIPKGVKRGVKKCFKGRGHISEDLSTTGDLIIEFEVEDHPFYKRNGDNAFCQVPISVVQAVLGTKVYIPKLYGDEKERLEVKVEPGTQPNDLIRMPGEGFQKFNCKKKRGDLEVSIKIEVPKQLTKEQRDMFEKLSLIENMLSLSSAMIAEGV